MRPTRDLVREALSAQEQERTTGFATDSAALDTLLQLPPTDVLGLIHELGSGERAERELGARLLSAPSLANSVVLEEVRAVAQAESDGAVLRWLVFALRNTKDPGAVTSLAAFATHTDARVRFGVPDGLSSCAARFHDIAHLLDLLSRDPDRDVRWSAAYEMGAWVSEPTPRMSAPEQTVVVERLREMAASDPDQDIRTLAQQAAAHDHLA